MIIVALAIPIIGIIIISIGVYLAHTNKLMYRDEINQKIIKNPDGSIKKIIGILEKNEKLLKNGKIADGEIVRFNKKPTGEGSWILDIGSPMYWYFICADVEYYNIYEKKVVCVRTPRLNGGRELIGDAKCTVYYDELGNFYVTNFTKQKFLKLRPIKLKYDVNLDNSLDIVSIIVFVVVLLFLIITLLLFVKYNYFS